MKKLQALKAGQRSQREGKEEQQAEMPIVPARTKEVDAGAEVMPLDPKPQPLPAAQAAQTTTSDPRTMPLPRSARPLYFSPSVFLIELALSQL